MLYRIIIIWSQTQITNGSYNLYEAKVRGQHIFIVIFFYNIHTSNDNDNNNI